MCNNDFSTDLVITKKYFIFSYEKTFIQVLFIFKRLVTFIYIVIYDYIYDLYIRLYIVFHIYSYI